MPHHRPYNHGMSKKTRRRKDEQRAKTQARRITVGKVVRLALKSLLFAVVASLLLVGLDAIGVPGLTNTWVQIGVLIVMYALSYPFLMSEFRAASYRGEEGREAT